MPRRRYFIATCNRCYFFVSDPSEGPRCKCPVPLGDRLDDDTVDTLFESIRNELLQTEKEFLEHLYIIRDVFQIPLEKSGKILTHAEQRILFGDLGSVIKLSETLIYEIERGNATSAVLKTLTPFMRMFASYSGRFRHAEQLYLKCMRKKKIWEFFQNAEQDQRCKGIKFIALLIMPVQRIPRYELFLKRLLESCNSDDPEYEKIRYVFKKVRSVAERMNDCVKDHENFENLFRLQKEFGLEEHIVGPGRKLIREGYLLKRLPSNTKYYEKRYFWLFTDILIMGRVTGDKKECDFIFPINHCRPTINKEVDLLTIKCMGHEIVLLAETRRLLLRWYTDIEMYSELMCKKLASFDRNKPRKVKLVVLGNQVRRIIERFTITAVTRREKNRMNLSLLEDCEVEEVSTYHADPLIETRPAPKPGGKPNKQAQKAKKNSESKKGSRTKKTKSRTTSSSRSVSNSKNSSILRISSTSFTSINSSITPYRDTPARTTANSLRTSYSREPSISSFSRDSSVSMNTVISKNASIKSENSVLPSANNSEPTNQNSTAFSVSERPATVRPRGRPPTVQPVAKGRPPTVQPATRGRPPSVPSASRASQSARYDVRDRSTSDTPARRRRQSATSIEEHATISRRSIVVVTPPSTTKRKLGDISSSTSNMKKMRAGENNVFKVPQLPVPGNHGMVRRSVVPTIKAEIKEEVLDYDENTLPSNRSVRLSRPPTVSPHFRPPSIGPLTSPRRFIKNEASHNETLGTALSSLVAI